MPLTVGLAGGFCMSSTTIPVVVDFSQILGNAGCASNGDCKKFALYALGDHVRTCITHSGAKKDHDWEVEEITDLFHTTHKRHDRWSGTGLSGARLTIKLDRLIVLSKSSLLGWFLHVSLIVIIKGRSPVEV